MFSLPVFRLDRTTAAFLAAAFAKCTVAGSGEKRPKNCLRIWSEDTNCPLRKFPLNPSRPGALSASILRTMLSISLVVNGETREPRPSVCWEDYVGIRKFVHWIKYFRHLLLPRIVPVLEQDLPDHMLIHIGNQYKYIADEYNNQ
jgi:hypothetical protein